jgi:hypothetical protein
LGALDPAAKDDDAPDFDAPLPDPAAGFLGDWMLPLRGEDFLSGMGRDLSDRCSGDALIIADSFQ